MVRPFGDFNHHSKARRVSVPQQPSGNYGLSDFPAIIRSENLFVRRPVHYIPAENIALNLESYTNNAVYYQNTLTQVLSKMILLAPFCLSPLIEFFHNHTQ